MARPVSQARRQRNAPPGDNLRAAWEAGATKRTPAVAGPNDAFRWKRDERVLWRSGPGFVVLLCPGSTGPLSLRGTGVALWAAVDRPRSLREIVERLSSEFAADDESVRSDVAPVIERLAEAGALRPVR